MENNLYQEIGQVLKHDIIDRHSYFQLKYFVIGKEPTHQARLWRCLRELESRKDSLNSINLEIQEVQDNMLLLDLDIKALQDTQDNPHKEINLRKMNRRKAETNNNLYKLVKKLKFVEEEANFFLQAFKGLEKLETLKPFDDQKMQEEYWNEKLSQDLNLSLMLQRPLDPELVKTILSLNNDLPIKKQVTYIINEIEDTRNKIKASLPK